MQFGRLCEALETARGTSSRNAKVTAIAGALALAAASGEVELRTAVRVALGDLSRLGVGWRALAGALAARLGETHDTRIVEATRRLGDLGAAAEELISGRQAEQATSAREPFDRSVGARPMALADVAQMVEGLRAASSRARRAALITAALSRSSALEAKFLVKALSGELRIGAAPGIVLLAIAEAASAPEADVRRAHGLVADLAEVAVLAFDKRLAEANVQPGRPLAFMLATPIETVKSPIDFSVLVAEEKLDGVRAQVHVHGEAAHKRVTIFARGLERVTDSFPEVAAAFSNVTTDLVLDGEILSIAEDGGPRPFQALQMRLNRKKPSEELLAEVPVCFVAFDVLVREGRVLVDEPWRVRRATLEVLAHDVGTGPTFAIKACSSIADATALDAAFDRARKNGHEGLVLKRKDAPYEAGKRGHSWLKVKKATATLDVVVTAAEQGHGNRASVISDYTFAVWKEGTLVDVGKAYSGLTDAEIDTLTRHFSETTIETRGGWRKVTPDVVLEVGFDGIQRSERHPSGFALRFPRILKIRTDKTPEECDTLETVEALFRAQVESGHREDGAPPVAKHTPSKAKPKPSSQLSLFETDLSGQAPERTSKRQRR
jgi:DNA ligase-1